MSSAEPRHPLYASLTELHRAVQRDAGGAPEQNATPAAAFYRRLGIPAGRLEQAVAAVESTAPLAAGVLAAMVADEHIQWDSDETVTAAAARFLADIAWSTRRDVHFPDLWTAYLILIEATPGTREEHATGWLARRSEILTALDTLGVQLGAPLLDASAAAARADLTSRGTWVGYVSRDQAPSADRTEPTRWTPITVDAWKLTRPGQGSRKREKRTWTLSVDATPGAVQAVLGDIGLAGLVGTGQWYQTGVSALGIRGEVPAVLTAARDELERRGYTTKF